LIPGERPDLGCKVLGMAGYEEAIDAIRDQFFSAVDAGDQQRQSGRRSLQYGN
jgi:hypothetical protein